MKKLLTLVSALALTLVVSFGQGFTASSLLNGTDAKFYAGTTDSAVTFSIDDAYNTNRTFVTVGGTTVKPKATNSVTGATYVMHRNAPLWGTGSGESATNVAVSITFNVNSAFTNTFSVFLQRSVNGGTDFDTVTANLHEITVTPVLADTDETRVVTLPPSLLYGTSHLRLYKVVTAANPTDGGIVTIKRATIGGWRN